MENNSAITDKVNIKRINCEGSDEEKSLAKKYNVNGYPTFKFHGKPNEELTNNIEALIVIIKKL